MRQILVVGLGVLVAVSVIVGFFALRQVSDERIDLTSRLQSRSQLLADTLVESIESSYNSGATTTVQRVVDRFASSERLAGLGIFDSSGVSVASSEDLPLPESKIVADAMDTDEAQGDFLYRDGESYYILAMPLHDDGRVVGALTVAQNATYIEDAIQDIWKDNLIRWLTQVVVFGFAIFVLVRFVFFRSIAQMTDSLQALRKEGGTGAALSGSSMFEPLVGEISKVTSSLRQARHAASEEARMRLEKLDSPWTAERLKEFIKAQVRERPIFVLSNGEPYVHSKNKNKIEWKVPAGGVITAIEPVMEACGGVWIAQGSGDADKEVADADGKLRVPPDEPKYTLKRVWLTKKEVAGFYNGFSNEALWPLCHMAHVRPQFRKEDWMEYVKVNAKFAKTLLDEIRHVERPIVLVQDYHLALVPEIIKRSRPDAQVSIFWHIPWPAAAQFTICPWRAEILRGMLGADLIGFHTQQYCNNFIDTVANEIESRIGYEDFSVFREAHQTFVRPFPISIAFPGNAEMPGVVSDDTLAHLHIRAEQLVLGVDRLDYIKGIPERIRGFEFFLEANPQQRGKVTLLQIGSPTRAGVEKYREYAEQIRSEVQRVNAKFAFGDWKPIILEERSYSHDELRALYRLAHVCLITSLHDGMNLVAKEYVAARSDEAGTLILSQFTGASRDMKGAILVNPYSAEDTAAALAQALSMPKSEQHRRMKTLRASVRDYNIYRWSAEILKSLSQLD
ncbi:MAG: trehalose-6-phosphate synthase [Candidatus Pacebacteria bacterium]|nr:trehalose-6-phosphate synthase [Candidatus Paceibacterota bacterium]